jgi:hypothetical protein
MILDDEVEVILFSHNIKYYENKGYKIPRKINKFGKLTVPRKEKILVKIEDLQKSSNVLVNWKCEDCGKIEKRNFNNCRKLCKSCSSKGELSRSWNGGTSNPHCIDCGRKIAKFGAKRCKICRAKTIIGKKNPMYGKPVSIERIEKQRIKKLQKGIWKTEKERKVYCNYWLKVQVETRKFLKELFEGWDGLDYYTKQFIRILPERDITVDHKISVYYGFINNISPKEIGKLENLCITSRKINSQKNKLTEEQFLRGNNEKLS